MKYLRNFIVLGIVAALCALYSYGSWSDELYNENIDPSSYGQTVDVVSQSFIASQQKVDQFRIMLSVLEKADWQLIDAQTQEVVVSGVFEKGVNANGTWYTADTQALVTPGKQYEFVVRTQKQPIGVHIVPSTDEQQNVVVNETEPVEGVVALSVAYEYFDLETFIVLIGLCAYVWFFIKFLQKLFK